ncbi:uncharacterized protein LAESUDRAFT_761047 [Laetiporus sulphureus 93-53]|uniref:WW domain-containing protein n=1 Tax=Laetiporus sulphureus 93-53 TaxID=1314785 RepID=A0A165DBC8_9APHY|nr:uncharacterized protein LAESUDRAFT_761047 [Laetiporus sulphureus 93-53]KZT04480.1 hypothetical protein LAESUDRAFT_761047 [Laetiporus sulphureus 93-53]
MAETSNQTLVSSGVTNGEGCDGQMELRVRTPASSRPGTPNVGSSTLSKEGFDSSISLGIISSERSYVDHAIATPAGITAVPPGFDTNPNVFPTALEHSGRVFLQPASPTDILDRRYARRPRIREYNGESQPIPAARRSFRHDDPPPPWTSYKHPEGQRYFGKKLLNKFQLFTDIWIYDRQKLSNIEIFEEQFLALLQEQADLPDGTEVAVYIEEDYESNSMTCHYYLSSDSDRAIFWLEEVEDDLLTLRSRPAPKNYYLQDATETQYWKHVEMFPNHRRVSTELLKEVKELVNFWTFDAMSSETSTAPQGLSSYLPVLNNIPDNGSAPSVCIIARVMGILSNQRFLDLHGQHEARLSREDTIYSQGEIEYSWLLRLVSPLLFFMPYEYFEQLRRVWVDQTVHHLSWSALRNGLQRDWDSLLTPATVMLTANVGLLAIQSIDTGHSARSCAQIASYVSTFLSLAIMFLCIILARYHKDESNAAETCMYLYQRTKLPAGLDMLAISFSLPAAMFLWCMVTFCVAVAWVCLDRTNLWTRFFTGLTLGFVLLGVTTVIIIELCPFPPDRVAPVMSWRDELWEALGSKLKVRHWWKDKLRHRRWPFTFIRRRQRDLEGQRES